MADFHRRPLSKSKELPKNDKPCSDECDLDLHPSPPSSSNHPLSPLLIFMICGLAVTFAFICCLALTARYRRRQRRRENLEEAHEDFVNEDLGPVIHHPIWLINTIGLEQSEIESIQLFKYRKDQGLIEGTDCSVCLSEFEEDESLRLLPKCSHAFHVPCIDTWLRSHKNCPLCRAPIIKTVTAQIETSTIDSNPIEPHTSEEVGPVEDSETLDHQVVEIEVNGEADKTSRTHDEINDGVRAHSNLADRHRIHKGSVKPRRSISMDEASASIIHLAVSDICPHDQETYSSNQSVLQSKKPNIMPKTGNKLRGSSSSIDRCSKSSSFGNSFRKMSSFTNKLPQNRSY